MSTTVINQNLKVTLSAKVGSTYLFEKSFTVANVNEVTDRVMTVPLTETTLMLFGATASAGTFIKGNVRFAAISNKDDINFIRLRLKKVITSRINTLGAITAGANYLNGTYNNKALTGGTGAGATANITVLGSGIYGFGGVTPGTGYTNGTYSSRALTGGLGTGATALIIVAGGVVTDCTITNRGTGFVVGNVLSVLAADIGGTGSGFSIPVATLAGGATAVNIVEKGTGYTNADSLSALNTDLGGTGSGFAVLVSTVETVSDIYDHKLEAGKFFVIGNTTINTDKVNGAFSAFGDIETISAQADTSAVDVGIYVASI